MALAGMADGWRITPSGWSRYLRKIKERGIAMKEELLKIFGMLWNMPMKRDAGLRRSGVQLCPYRRYM